MEAQRDPRRLVAEGQYTSFTPSDTLTSATSCCRLPPYWYGEVRRTQA
jgi:hypothetical protein